VVEIIGSVSTRKVRTAKTKADLALIPYGQLTLNQTAALNRKPRGAPKPKKVSTKSKPPRKITAHKFHTPKEIRKRLNTRIRAGFSTGIRKGGHHGKRVFDILGYTADEARLHIEKQFTDDMAWDNYRFDTWHIDHIKPVAKCEYTTSDCPGFKECWALSNLQPLAARINRMKHDTWVGIHNWFYRRLRKTKHGSCSLARSLRSLTGFPNGESKLRSWPGSARWKTKGSPSQRQAI
jgi:hypothetical protein